MSRLVRGVFWRSGQALSLLALAAVVVGGSVMATAFSQVSDTPEGALGVLLLLGVVVLAVQAAQSAQSRRSEMALAQLRGLGGSRLLTSFATEPVVLVLVGAAIGLGLARFVVGFAADRWLEASERVAAREFGTVTWYVVAVAVGASIAAIVVGSWRAVREPVASQLDTGRRPRPSATTALFGYVVVLVAAVLGTYQAASGTGTREGWAGLLNPALLSPVLLGLAAGQLAVWLVRGIAAVLTQRTRTRGAVPTFLAARRLARRADSAYGTRIVVAAGVVAAITASGASDVAGWQNETTRLMLGGPVSFRVDDGPGAAYDLSHEADPDGRWLMAMVKVPDESDAYRRSFADLSRWDAVVGSFYAGTAARDVTDHVDAMQDGTIVDPIIADDAAVTFQSASLSQNFAVSVSISYQSVDNSGGLVEFKVRRDDLERGAPTVTITQPVSECQVGCIITQVGVTGFVGRVAAPEVEISSLRFGDEELLERDTFSVPRGNQSRGTGEQRGTSLFIGLSNFGNTVGLRPDSGDQTLAALVTPGLRVASGGGGSVGYSVDGTQRSIDPIGEVDGVPFLGADGMLLDLPRAMTSGTSVIPASTSYVVARADTPAGVLDALTASGQARDPVAFESALADVRADADAQGVRLFVVMSVCAMLVAVIGLASAVSHQRDERRREAAGLRIVGIRSRDLAAALRVEAAGLALITFLVVFAVGWLGGRLTIKGLALIPESRTALPLQVSGNPLLIVVVSAGAAGLVGVLTLLLNRTVARSARPALLREAVAG